MSRYLLAALIGLLLGPSIAFSQAGIADVETSTGNRFAAAPFPTVCTNPPANNCFTSPTTVSPSGATLSQSTVGAVLQTGEPRPCGSFARTVWHTWTPTTTGSVTIETVGSNYNTVLAVYTGTTLTGLTNVACNDDIGGGNLQSRVTFTATAGTTYRIQVGGTNSATGNLVLKVAIAAPSCPGPSNNCFANPTIVTSRPYTNTQSTSGATVETSEPTPCGSIGATVWYKYIAGSTRTITIDTIGANYDTVLAVYTGAGLNSLTNLACNDDIGGGGPNHYRSRVSFSAIAGTTYWVQAGGYQSTTGTLKINLN